MIFFPPFLGCETPFRFARRLAFPARTFGFSREPFANRARTDLGIAVTIVLALPLLRSGTARIKNADFDLRHVAFDSCTHKLPRAIVCVSR